MEQTLGKRISAHRKRLGFTQDQLAEKLGVTAQAVSKWENDQSCPDIAMLPKLAEIFGTSIDMLLGKEPESPVHKATIVDDNDEDNQGSWEFQYDNSRRSGIGFACFVILTGILWLISNYLEVGINLWDIAFPTALLVFGLWGLYPRFSFLRLGSFLLGAYFLLNHFSLLPFDLSGKGLLLPAFLVIFGLSLLLDAIRKPYKPKFSFTYNSKKNHATRNNFRIDGGHLDFSASFGEQHQMITMDCLHDGCISTSFGDYTLDFSGVASLAPHCHLEISNSFGELTLLIPRRYQVIGENSTAFACIDMDSSSAGSEGTIFMDANCSFGQLNVQYI